MTAVELAHSLSERVRTKRLIRAGMVAVGEEPEPGVAFDHLSSEEQQTWIDTAEAALEVFATHNPDSLVQELNELGAVQERRGERVAALIENMVMNHLPVNTVHNMVYMAMSWEVHRTYEISVWARKQARKLLGVEDI